MKFTGTTEQRVDPTSDPTIAAEIPPPVPVPVNPTAPVPTAPTAPAELTTQILCVITLCIVAIFIFAIFYLSYVCGYYILIFLTRKDVGTEVLTPEFPALVCFLFVSVSIYCFCLFRILCLRAND